MPLAHQRPAGLPVRLRKLVGSAAVLLFLLAYVGAVTSLYRFVPDNQAARLAYFAAAGLLWGVPVLPLLRWMNGRGE
ncbi:MAG: DUF2842 domain-containing protein [Caulobacteraceae bacterium]|nr:DUF2842 domain-containing protein [Caulobacter sp.]